MVDVTYSDAVNAYTQKKTVSLSSATPFLDWSFPVITETGGKVVYSATILYKDGTSTEIPETTATRTTIQLGDIVSDRLEVQVVPDLLDFTTVKLANVSLHYEDPANAINERADFMFKTGDQARAWKVDLKDKSKTEYHWSAKFFLVDGTHREIADATTEEMTLLLELPAA
jgi:hypothetical protein